MMSLQKLSLIVLILFLSVPVAYTRTQALQDGSKPATTHAPDYPNLKKHAQASADAFLARDYQKFLTFIYPRLVELVGGPDAMIDMVKGGMREIEAKGLKTLSYTIGEPGPPTQIAKGLFAIVPTKMRMQTPLGVMADESFMIGISRDGGENWTFLSGEGTTNEAQLRMILPEVVGKLKFPEKKTPYVEANP